MRPHVSVAMAVYNGEKFLSKQIASILCQLDEGDEIIMSVDPSTDMSKAVALELAAKDSRIRVIEGPGRGVIKNFENALKTAIGNYVFLADQDDVWMEGKLIACLAQLEKENVTAVMHDAVVTDESLQKIRDSFFEGSYKPGVCANIKRNRFIGCCMGLSREVLDLALPFPKRLPMHDQWLGILAEKIGTVVFIEKPLLLYRRHEQSFTGKRKSSFLRKAIWRFNILTNYVMRGLRYAKH